ncbi:MAG: adenosylmethionine--8-amino-7-oxononanoate transaminase [Nevskiaceae bacterium]|nr:MAG: adenosylmethionine--8-amino-7-oxononanoate transaminase [Nevskiaceae bacterium]TAM28215.1 MAG: adenosylmethionine--8-amino-7-oxononanoate transaminase [Nevskiaceae bacterium]
MTSNADWRVRSLAHVWQPCTQMQDHASGELPLIPIARADGVWLEDFEGKRYLDAVSSWWTNLWGHRHPAIVAALKHQLDTLDHVIFAGFTHEPAIALAEQLAAKSGLPRCFYTDNGSSAVEAALKMSFHFWLNSGKPQKQRFIALQNSYHGETLGALAVGGPSIYRDTYAPLLLQPIFVPSPDCYTRTPGQSWEDHSRRQFDHLRLVLEQHAHEVCALILEPLVQCAGGMRMYHPLYLTLARQACDEFGVHLIADEIAVGFGRTGSFFACEQAPPAVYGRGAKRGITPDFMCLSKGLTGGTLPLAAVMTREEIYQAFYADYAAYKAFLHSHSYTGNPLACRAGLASLSLFEETNALSANAVLAQLLWAHTAELRTHRHVAEVRQTGLILAVEMVRNVAKREDFPASERRGLRAYRHALEKGVVLRPLGNVLYLMPPYAIGAKEAQKMCEVLCEAVDVATRDPA